MASWSADVTQVPSGLTVLNEPMVLFRGADGEVGALADACPHRAVPLSLGRVEGNNVVCPYHGIEFDRGGVCRRNPHVAGPADRLRTRAFPIIERYGMVWVWPGDPAEVAGDLLPDYAWFDQPERYTSGCGYVHIEADYRLIIDNLMDLAHADYIHANTVGQPGAAEVQQVSVRRDGQTVSVGTIWPDLPPSALHEQAWTRTERVDKYLDMKWQPASNLLLERHGARRGAGNRHPHARRANPYARDRALHPLFLDGRARLRPRERHADGADGGGDGAGVHD